MKKQSFIQGGLILAGMGIVSKFLGLFFRWPLVMMMGDEGMGYYQMVFPIFSVFIAVAGGIPIALSKIISENNDTGKEGDNISLVKISTCMLIVLAVLGGLAIFMFKDVIVKGFGWDAKVLYSLLAISVAPIFIAVVNPIRGYFQGYKTMNETAISQFLEQVGRVVIGVGLAYVLIPKGIEYAAAGAVLGAAGGGAIASVYLLYKFFRLKPRNVQKRRTSNLPLAKKIVFATLPIAIGAAVVSVMGMIDSGLVPKKLLEAGFSSQQATILFSQLTGKATALVHIPLTLSVAIGSALVPAIASSNASKNFRELSQNIGMSLKFSFVIALPCAFGMFSLAEPIMATIFPGNDGGAYILRYLSISIPFLVLMQITTSILQGLGKMKIPVINMIIGSLIKVALTITLVPIKSININGAVISSIVAYAIITILNMSYLKYYTKYKVNWLDILLKPLFASLIMMVCALASFLLIIDTLRIVPLTCLISIAIGGAIYGILILVLKVFDYETLKGRAEKKINRKVS